MELVIMTPDKNLFEGEVKSVYIPGIGILNRHAALISSIKPGDIRIDGEGGKQSFPVNGGVIEVLKNKVVILAE